MNGSGLTLLAAMASDFDFLPYLQELRWPAVVIVIAVALIIRCGPNFGRLIENLFVKAGKYELGRQREIPPEVADPPPTTTTPTDTEGEPSDDARFLLLRLVLVPSTKGLLAMLAHVGESQMPELEYIFMHSGLGTLDDFKAAWVALEACRFAESRGNVGMTTEEGRDFLRFLSRSTTEEAVGFLGRK